MKFIGYAPRLGAYLLAIGQATAKRSVNKYSHQLSCTGSNPTPATFFELLLNFRQYFVDTPYHQRLESNTL